MSLFSVFVMSMLYFLYLSGLCFVVIFGDTVKIGIPVSVDGVVYVVAYVLILSFY